jgi:hypothetical protein
MFKIWRQKTSQFFSANCHFIVKTKRPSFTKFLMQFCSFDHFINILFGAKLNAKIIQYFKFFFIIIDDNLFLSLYTFQWNK